MDHIQIDESELIKTKSDTSDIGIISGKNSFDDLLSPHVNENHDNNDVNNKDSEKVIDEHNENRVNDNETVMLNTCNPEFSEKGSSTCINIVVNEKQEVSNDLNLSDELNKENASSNEGGIEKNSLSKSISEVRNVNNVSENYSKMTGGKTIPDASNNNDDFVPTIIAIRGACSDVVDESNNEKQNLPNSSKTAEEKNISQKSESPRINIVKIQGGLNNINTNLFEKVNNERTASEKSDTETINDVDNNDSLIENFSRNSKTVSMNENNSNSLTSKNNVQRTETPSCEDKEQEVYVIESTSRTPLPIPIKMEPNMENEKQQQTLNSKNSVTDKLVGQKIAPKLNEYITLSSDSEKEDSRTSGERAKSSKPVSSLFTSVGYTCHLCDTTFQEHELLNEHMILHRNNSLVQKNAKSHTKFKPRQKMYTCQVCRKRLSTWQSLQQHTMIHNNEKPFVCPLCKKDFRHLSNFKMHLERHQIEDEARRLKRNKMKLDRSSMRAVDFGRLVGPLFVKESLLNNKCAKKEAFAVKPNEPTRQSNEDTEDDVIPLKTFTNIENIVMNATKLIVKLDDLDPSIVKRKIKTPDISIDKNSMLNRFSRKRKIILTPTDASKRLKLEQIENIIMDETPEPVHDTGQEDDYRDNDCFGFDVDDDDDDVVPSFETDDANAAAKKKNAEVAAASALRVITKQPETLTDNELFELLNDDTVGADSNVPAAVSASASNKPSPIRRTYPSSSKFRTVDSGDKARILTAPNIVTKRVTATGVCLAPTPPMTTKSKPLLVDVKREIPNVNDTTTDIWLDDDDIKLNAYDAFDTAFHRFAFRRLQLIRQKAAQTDGKVASKFLLGPLFWKKALRRAKANTIDTASAETRLQNFKSSVKRFGSRYRNDNRRTNDPTKLQIRAENKLKFVLDRIGDEDDVSNVNLAGPLFWRKTLKLAGVRRTEDLKLFLQNERVSLDDVRFVRAEDLPKRNENVDSAAAAADKSVVDDTPSNSWQRVSRCTSGDNDAARNQKPGVHTIVADVHRQSDPDKRERNDELSNTTTTNNSDKTKLADVISNDDNSSSLKTAATDKTSANRTVRANDSDPTNESKRSVGTGANLAAADDAAAKKNESILYDSLTKPKNRFTQMFNAETNIASSAENSNDAADASQSDNSTEKSERDVENGVVVEKSLTNDSKDVVDGTTTSAAKTKAAGTSPKDAKKSDSKLSTRLTERYKLDISRNAEESESESARDEAVPDNGEMAQAAANDGNIILNVDGDNFQIVAQDGGKLAGETAEGGANYVLISDGNGGMQLVNENDLQFVDANEDDDGTGGTQFVVNVDGDNYSGNFEVDGGDGEKLTYALQFDGENYTAVQLVRGENEDEEAATLPDVKPDVVADDPKMVEGENYVLAESTADLNHIGKELSDFLNIDYGNLLKNESDDQK